MSGPSVEALIQFIRAGGTLTLSEWIELSPEVRAALAQAGEERAAERDQQLAAEIVDMIGSALVQRKVDRDLDGAMARLAEKAREGGNP